MSVLVAFCRCCVWAGQRALRGGGVEGGRGYFRRFVSIGICSGRVIYLLFSSHLHYLVSGLCASVRFILRLLCGGYLCVIVFVVWRLVPFMFYCGFLSVLL